MLSTVFSEQSVRAWFDTFIDTEGSDGGVEYDVLAYWHPGLAERERLYEIVGHWI